MRKIVSVSLGSSKRDHSAEVELLGEKFEIKRIGTDGDFKKAQKLLIELDGKVDAIGLGGLDIYLYTRNERYALKDGLRLKEVVKNTPVVDGSGLKNTLEREVVKYLLNEDKFKLKEKKILMVSAMDRFGMAQAFWEAGCKMIFGDLIFALQIDKPIFSLEELEEYAKKLLPEICKLPISFLYPVGKEQEKEPEEKYVKYYNESDLIAGDFHFIKKYLPKNLQGKIILTNTVTKEDLENLKAKNVSYLITTTPEFQGRSFGTNVLEAALLAILQKKWEEITPNDYLNLINKLKFKARIEKLN
ncbi:MAG: quinate 5-dehydrogenase [Armatimonadetes bacterium]|nr:quinate 5-dehydrogenase [Armatimonadota bacterium]